LFFLSGALFPITNLPAWLAPFILVNPVTYAVDGIRGALLGFSRFDAVLDFAIVCLFAVVMVLIGTYAFKKMKI
jgi:ABC-2 type transport system permease protein